MKKAYRLFAQMIRLIFEVFFTYLMLAMLSMGFDKILWVGVIAGLIGITLGITEAVLNLVTPEVKGLDVTFEEMSTQEPKLYYKIRQVGELYCFEVFAQNHELICVSDAFATHDGALTGLWYLMDAMKSMNELNWECHSN